jgi:hypothetical protein
MDQTTKGGLIHSLGRFIHSSQSFGLALEQLQV